MPARNRIKTTCSNCHKEIEIVPWRIKRAKNNYCSTRCQQIHNGILGRGKKKNQPLRHKSLIEIVCDHCEKPVLKEPRLVSDTRNYCGRKCAGEGYSRNYKGDSHPLYSHTEKKCDWCGCGISVTPKQLRNHKHHFCSRECADRHHSTAISGENSPLWKGGDIDYYGPNWHRQRRYTRKRDGYKCQHCGISENKLGRQLDVHHITPFREFDYIKGQNDNYKQANRSANLISLCHHCHRKAEYGRIAVQPRLV